MKYKKKPVIIEAFQYDGDFIYSDNTPYEAPEWIFEALENGTMYFEGPGELYIKTLEGNHHISCGDFIIQGVKNELYPCKPDIFEATYEKVNDENPEVVTKETSLSVRVESIIEGAESFLMKCPSCDKRTISSQQAYIHDNIKREWYCRTCGQKLNNHNLLKGV